VKDIYGPIYTEMLKGGVVEEVRHQYYGGLLIRFESGRCIEFRASGDPPTIFIRSLDPETTRPIDQLDDPLSGVKRGHGGLAT